MSEYSSSPLELQEEEEEDLYGDISSSSNSGSILVENFLAGIANQPNFNDTQIDSSLLSHSSIADVSVFPSKVRFPTTFPNMELKQKLLFSNSGMSDEHFTVKMTGDCEFRVEETEIDLPAGNCYPLFVTFHPKVVSLFQASLIFEGSNSIVVTLLGHCVPSPLDFPSPASSLWKFPNSKSHRTFAFSNRSYSIALDVEFSVNSPSVTVDPMQLSLDPGSCDHIVVSFDPSFANLRDDPSITIKCEKSGDNVTIPLQFVGPRSCTVVDFGAIAVGAQTTQKIQLKSPQIAPRNISWPFSITDANENGIEQPEFTFCFSSKRPGTFRQILNFESFDIELVGKATDPPFALKIPSKYPNRPVEFRNTAQRTIRFMFQAPKGYMVDLNEIILRPNQVGKVNVMSESGTPGSPEIIVLWNNADGKLVTDHVPLTKEGNSVIAEPTEISIIEEPSGFNISAINKQNSSRQSVQESRSDMNSVSMSQASSQFAKTSSHIRTPKSKAFQEIKSSKEVYVSPPKPYTLSLKGEASPKHVTNSNLIDITKTSSFIQDADGFVSSSKFIPFFGVSYENPQSFELTIIAPSDFSVIAPNFVKLSTNKFSSNVPFTLTSDSSPRTENTDYLKVVSNGKTSMQIPIISYRGTSFLEFDTNVVINNNKAILDVHNGGERAAFVTFAVNNDAKVKVSPLAKILNQYETQRFIFSFQTDPEKADVSIIFGDEIIRQIKAELRPSEFYAKTFGSQKIKPELTLIKSALFSCDRREIASITRKYIHQAKLRFISNNQITFSPAILEFNSLSVHKKLTIFNTGAFAIPYEIQPIDNSVEVSNESGVIQPNSQVKLNILLLQKSNSLIKVICDSDIYEIPVEYKENSSFLNNNLEFSASTPIVEFGQIEIGLSGESSITLTNHKYKDIKLMLSIDPKNAPFQCQPTVSISSNSTVSVPIVFSPSMDDVFEGKLLVENQYDQLEIKLLGEGITVSQDESESSFSDSDCVVFPPCNPGVLRRAKVRVSNRSNKVVEINAVSSPPFICPIEQFHVETNSFVWFPIHFIPKVEGIYEGSLEFKADNGKITVVTLKGICE